MNPRSLTTHNLPDRVDGFINRENEIKTLDNYLLKKKFRYISISGEGGIGKTSLVIEFAYLLLATNAFESIVWVTPKKFELIPKDGFLNIFNPNVKNEDVSLRRIEEGTWATSLDDLYQTILSVSGYRISQNDTNISFDLNDVIAWMNVHKVLLIIDDLDSWDWGEIINFIEKVPPDSAVIITSRRLVESQYLPGVVQLDLNSLSLSVAFKLIEKKCQDNDINLETQHKRKIYDFSGGNPLIIQLMIALVVKRLNRVDLLYPLRAIGWLKEISIKETVDKIIDTMRDSSEAKKFLFDDLYNHLTTDEKNVLLAVAVLQSEIPEKPNIKKLEKLTLLPFSKLQKILRELSNSALLQQDIENPASFYLHEYISGFVASISQEDTEDYKRKVKELFLKNSSI